MSPNPANEHKDAALDHEALRRFRERTGYEPEDCPPEVEAEMMWEIDDDD